ncbi:MAG: HEAT repeat domain-containing protein [Pyrinomonadaceae bacterium]
MKTIRLLLICLVVCVTPAAFFTGQPAFAQGNSSTNSGLTPLQREIETQRRRLASAEVEERRDALAHLGNLKRPESSRVALVALNDSQDIVRGTAAHSLGGLPATEVVAALIPMLHDKSEFVRQEAAYVLGETRNRAAVEPLIASLSGDKKNSVRGAAAVALGEIGEPSAVVSLASILNRDAPERKSGKDKKSGKKENEFVLRAVARALGQIGNRAGVPALTNALLDEKNPDDLRREAAQALGLIGDPSSEPALRTVLNAPDPHLSRVAQEALRRIHTGLTR